MRLSSSLVLLSGLLLPSAIAQAHVTLASGPAPASTTQKITFGVGHGCETGGVHSDTIKIRVDIPAGVTSVRPLFSDFGKPTVTLTGTTVTAVEWTKATGDFLEGDDAYYELTLRARTPGTPFTQLQFNVTQTCRDGTVVRWDQGPTSTTGNPAPMLNVTPAHTSGWNEITVPAAVAAADLARYFGDAQIVWRGNAAFSTNAATMAQIGITAGVTVLGELAANDKIWVKY